MKMAPTPGGWNGAFEWLNIHEPDPEYDPVEIASIMAKGHTQDKAKEIIREKMPKGFFQSEYKVSRSQAPLIRPTVNQ